MPPAIALQPRARLRSGAFLTSVLVWCFCLLWAATEAWAGSEEATNDAQFHAPTEIAAWHAQVTQTLEGEGVRAAIIARSGRPRTKLPAGLLYVHSALLVHEPAQAADGTITEGWFVYQLFRDADDKHHSHLSIQPLETFLAGSYEPDVGVLVPVPELQGPLIDAMRAHGQALHRPSYHLLANPHRTEFDNCNTWLLRIMFVALYQTTDEARLQAKLEAYFEPDVIELGFWYRVGGNLGNLLEYEDKGPNGYQTVTYRSFSQFLTKHRLLAGQHTFAITDPE
ncbi:MAG: DUF2145 domain-containing protein [Verrucomicrobiota bacterium JB022]|nr:DUF2145 domain-containing protein [Verrucomicrobiota bacterium JB022]